MLVPMSGTATDESIDTEKSHAVARAASSRLPRRWFDTVVLEVAGLRLAVLTLVALAAVLSACTLYEKKYGSLAAAEIAYRSPIFLGLMGLLGLNILASAVVRYPWKRSQAWFVVTHAGLLTLLTGALLSYRGSVDGMMKLTEGEVTDSFGSRQESIVSSSAKAAPFNTVLPVWDLAGAPTLLKFMTGQGPDKLPDTVGASTVTLRDGLATVGPFYPAAEAYQEIESLPLAGIPDRPAVKLRLTGTTPMGQIVDEPLWLAVSPDRRATSGTLAGNLLEVTLAASGYSADAQEFAAGTPPKSELGEQGRVTVRFGAKTVTMDVAGAGGRPVAVGSGWQVRIVDVASGVARADIPVEVPAVRVEVTPANGEARRWWVSGRIPFQVAAEGVNTSIPLGLKYEHPAAVLPSGFARVELLMGPDGKLRYRLLDGRGVEKGGVAESGKVIGEMGGLQLVAEQVVPAGRLAEQIRPVDAPASKWTKSTGALGLTIQNGTRPPVKTTVLRGTSRTIMADGVEQTFSYGYKAAKLPCKVSLANITKVMQPGSAEPAWVEATLGITPPGEARRTEKLTVNRPAVVDGYSFYLADIGEEGGRPVATIGVRNDPGTWVKYAGAVILSIGVIGQFWLKGLLKANAGPLAGASVVLFLLAIPAVATAAEPATDPAPREWRGASSASEAGSADELLERLPVVEKGMVQPLWLVIQQRMSESGAYFLWFPPNYVAFPAWLSWAAETPNELPNEVVLKLSPELQRLLGHSFPWMFYSVIDRMAVADPKVEELKRRAEDVRALFDPCGLYVPNGTLAGGTVSGTRLDTIVPREVILKAVQGDRASAQRVFDTVCRAAGPAVVPWRLTMQIKYATWHPFRWAWFTFVTAAWLYGLAYWWPKLRSLAGGIMVLALVFSVGGFAMRISVTGWAPVTNFFETLVWVGLVSALVSVGVALTTKGSNRQAILLMGCVVGGLTMLLADNLPVGLGRAMRGLPPALQSNVWLGSHVLTIVSSYAAFALAWLMGNVQLARHWIGGKNGVAAAETQTLYRTVQVGTFLVIVGTILGGLWADVSWGRFWGWDPKEVWALIVALVYLALLHGRFAGWVGAFGLAAGSVLAFMAVVMSWYGVNFLLGMGLHSYGFGTGGESAVFTAIALQTVFLLAAVRGYRRNLLMSGSVVRPAVVPAGVTDVG